MPPQRNHLQNQSLVCLLCFERGLSPRKITGVTLERVQKFFIENFDPMVSEFPCVICAHCNKLLIQVDKGEKDPSDLPVVTDFSTLSFPRSTRSNAFTNLDDLQGCTCSICKIATACTIEKGNKLGNKKNVSTVKTGRPSNGSTPATKPLSRPVTICHQCFQVIGQGISHPKPCGIRERRNNLHNVVLNNERGAELLVSKVLKSKVAESSTDDEALNIASGSRTLKVPKPLPPPSRSSQALYQNEAIPTSEIRK